MVFLDYCIFSAGVQYEFRNLQISVSEATHNKNGVFARGVVLYDDTVLMDLHLLKYFNLLNYLADGFIQIKFLCNHFKIITQHCNCNGIIAKIKSNLQ